jgi:hypothetical protein
MAMAMTRGLVRLVLSLCMLLLPATAARAWLAPGHMAAGAITYDALQARDPQAVAAIVQLMQSHPDRARFDRRLQGLSGPARDRRLFELMARWPDDVRRTPYDHPRWHYSEQVQSGLRRLLPFGFGFAPYAFHHALTIARDTQALPGDRAIALCWVLHIVEDLHEPLHTGMWMSRRFPMTDKGGTIAWVRTSPTARPETLHWLWDSAGDPDPDGARRRDPDALAAQVEAAHATPAATTMPKPDPDQTLATWLRHSRELARHVAYGDGKTPLGTAPEAAPVLSLDYLQAVQTVTAEQLFLAGACTADLLVGLR